MIFSSGDINHELQAQRLFVWFWQTNLNMNWVLELIKPLEETNNQLKIVIDRLVSLQLNYTGQHLSLETMLNDFFDSGLRRIIIKENDVAFLDGVTMFVDGEILDPIINLYLDGEVNPNPLDLLVDLDQGTLSEYHYTVCVPVGVLFDYDKMSAYINIFNLADKTYNFETYIP